MVFISKRYESHFFYAKIKNILKNIYNSINILAKKILFLYNKLVGKSGYSQKERKPLAETKRTWKGLDGVRGESQKFEPYDKKINGIVAQFQANPRVCELD